MEVRKPKIVALMPRREGIEIIKMCPKVLNYIRRVQVRRLVRLVSFWVSCHSVCVLNNLEVRPNLCTLMAFNLQSVTGRYSTLLPDWRLLTVGRVA